ncbi:hypothetical protein EDC01DRAFT_627097 [Geopyxis carbonaria]|nr:hypothetical protein EDC01DRAFT_627097 [Geopyxis carbonaria]
MSPHREGSLAPSQVAMTPAPQGPDESNGSEVFLGPTGSETEEFYSYQRKNPGLDKSQYLEWFQKRFNKEIELRRRRSDQPSDLEFMVIKKRSKYRERIGEESDELVAYSKAHPTKTYRELAEWFQKRFQKEIDITAISRRVQKAGEVPGEALMLAAGAIKRNRQDGEIGMPPHADQAPPAAKRGRRSLGSSTQQLPDTPNGHHQQIPSGSHLQGGGGPVGSNPTFAVDMHQKQSHSTSHTPNNLTPNHTPKNRNANLSTPDENGYPLRQSPQSLPHPGPPPPPQPALLRRHHESPEQAPNTPMWNPVNTAPGGGGGPFAPKIEETRSPPRLPSINPMPMQGPPGSAPPQSLPPMPPTSIGRQIRRKSISMHQPPVIAPAPPPPQAQPPPPPRNYPPQMVRPYSPRRDISMHGHLQNRFQNIVDKQIQGAEELRQCETDIFSYLNDKTTMERLLREDLHAMQVERDHFRESVERYKGWNEELQRGNLELQDFRTRYQKMKEQLHREQQEVHYISDQNRQLAARLNDTEKELDTLRAAAKENGVGRALRSTVPVLERGRDKREFDEWIHVKFAAEAVHEKELKKLVDECETAGWKDLHGRIHTLKAYLDGMCRERGFKQDEWRTMLGRVYGSQSPIMMYRPEEAADDADDECDANDHLKESKQSSKAPSIRTASRTASPSTASTSPISTAPDSDTHEIQPSLKRKSEDRQLVDRRSVDKMDEDL